VAQQLGLPRQAVSEIENARRAVSAAELFAFSRLFAIPVEDFLGDVEPGLEAEPVLLRADSLSVEGKQTLATFQRWCRDYRELEEVLGQVREPDLPALPSSVARFEDAWQLARRERQRLDLGAAPAWSVLEALEERVGVKVLGRRTDWGLSGACVLSRVGPGMFLNAAHPAPRRIFTLAHEYFHLLVAHTGGPSQPQAYTCSAAPEKKTREDQLADQFAAELLMPADSVEERLALIGGRHEPPSGVQIIRLALLFGVSTQAMLFRLGNLGKLGKHAPAERYADPDLRQQDRERREFEGEPPVTPHRFDGLAIEAYLSAHISSSRLAELLDVPLPEVETRVQPFRAGDALDAELRDAR
jgi:Zn-dependent peptidase ImmA (M78 family)